MQTGLLKASSCTGPGRAVAAMASDRCGSTQAALAAPWHVGGISWAVRLAQGGEKAVMKMRKFVEMGPGEAADLRGTQVVRLRTSAITLELCIYLSVDRYHIHSYKRTYIHKRVCYSVFLPVCMAEN